MQHHQQHEVERGGQSAQQTHNEIMTAQLKLAQAIAKMMVNLVKSFGKKGQNEESTIEIKVDGKTKLKGTVKDGKFTASKNELTADEVKSLKAYFASLPNPAIKPKDFEVMVDNKTILATKDGAVVSHATPTATPEQAAEAKRAFATIQQSPPAAAEQRQQAPVAQSKGKVEPIKTKPLNSETRYSAPPPTQTPPPIVKTTVTVESQRTVSPPPVIETTAKAPDSHERKENEHSPKVNSSTVSKQDTNRYIPENFGVQKAQGLSMEQINQLQGCPDLRMTYGKLEEYRQEINSDRERAASAPGMDYITSSKSHQELIAKYEKLLPSLEPAIDKAVERGKLTVLDAQPNQSGQEQTNRELLQNGKGALALLSDRPVGERQWEGKNYTMSEGKDGSFRITEKSRGEILNYTNGKVQGTATPQDLYALPISPGSIATIDFQL